MANIEWHMSCEVNGEEFQFEGQGHGDAATGTVKMEYEASRFPKGFDPISCPMICNAPATMPFARAEHESQRLLEIAKGQFSVEPARSGSIYNAQGEQILGLSVSSVVKEKNGGIVIGNQMKGFSLLPEIASNITPVEEYIVPNGPGRALSAIRFRLQAKTGEMLTGMTTVPYVWQGVENLSAPLTRTYELIDVRWDGKVNVKSTIRSAIAPLFAQPAIENSRPAKASGYIGIN